MQKSLFCNLVHSRTFRLQECILQHIYMYTCASCFEGKTYQNPHKTQVFISPDPNALTSSVISWLPKSKCENTFIQIQRDKDKHKTKSHFHLLSINIMLYFTFSQVNTQSLLFIMFLHNRVSSISMADWNFSICRFHSV